MNKNTAPDQEARILNEISPVPEQATADRKDDLQKKLREDFTNRIASFHDARCMKMWEIVMISMGVLPFSNLLGSLKRDNKSFKKEYNRRIRFLKRRLSPYPEKGLALVLPYYPGTETDAPLNQQYLDVVSAFEVLREKYETEIPAEVRDLEKSALRIPFPTSAHDDIPENKKLKREQAKTIAALLNKNMQTLFIELVQKEYGTLTAATLPDTAKAMEKDLKRAGMKAPAIESQLKLALSGKED